MRRYGLALALLLCASPALAAPARVGAQFRYWAFDDANDIRGPLAYVAKDWWHAQLEVWDRVHGEDRVRPELGVHLRDMRRSSYSLEWRHEDPFERFTLGTDQVLGEHVVGRVAVSPLVSPDSTQWVVRAGLDYYWRSYNFMSADVIRDPRGDGLWVVPVRVRLANEQNDWVQLTVAPASERSIGWAADLKFHWLRLGLERNSRFDFTDRDNVITTVGVEFRVPKPAE